jgi:hypothetical protein
MGSQEIITTARRERHDPDETLEHKRGGLMQYVQRRFAVVLLDHRVDTHRYTCESVTVLCSQVIQLIFVHEGYQYI